MPTTRYTTRTFRYALRRVTLSVRQVGKAMGVSGVTLQQYLTMSPPSERMAVRLRKWLERYAGELLEIASKLPEKERKAR